mgnify:CR=1 FL=1
MNNEPVFFHTTCCAMGILSANNATPFKDLKDDLERIKTRSLSRQWKTSDRSGGERSFLCVTTPNEKELEQNLVKLGFEMLADDLNRRVGYPDGKLKLWIVKW